MAKPCKHGKLKHPIGRRRCKKAGGKVGKARARGRRASACAGPITSASVTDRRGRTSTRCTCLTQRAIRCPGPPRPTEIRFAPGETMPIPESMDGALGAWRRRSRF